MTDKKSCSHLKDWSWTGTTKAGQVMAGNSNTVFSFCPLCGQPLQKTALDRVILKAAGLDPTVELFPTQSLWDAVELLKKAQFRRDQDCISIDLLSDGSFVFGVSGLWWPGSQSEARETTLAKALLWTVSSLTVEDIEKLFEPKLESDFDAAKKEYYKTFEENAKAAEHQLLFGVPKKA